jgi:hypothetical protein
MYRVANGAEFQTALNPKRREIPNDAKFRTAQVPNDAKRRSELSAVWDLAQYGTSRRLGFRAVCDFAPFGT